MSNDILDPRVRVIVTLRRNGHSDDEVTSFMALFDTVSADGKERLSQVVGEEDPEIIRKLVQVLPDVHAAMIRKGDRTPEQIIEEAARTLS